MDKEAEDKDRLTEAPDKPRKTRGKKNGARARNDNLAEDEDIVEHLEKLYDDIEAGFEAEADRHTDIVDNWKMYRCELDAHQLFNGRNQLYLPLVYDATRARATRFTNQLFPQNGKHVECTTADGTLPRAALAILERHIDKARLRELAPAMFIAGDLEGNYNLYVQWQDKKRYVTKRVSKPVEVEEGVPAGKTEDVEEEEISEGGPLVDIIPDADICILPATASGLDDAIAQGGSVTIVRRWNKARIKQAIKDEEIGEDEGEELLENMNKQEDGKYLDSAKAATKAAGLRKDGRGKWALVYETWTNLEVDDEERLCQIFFAGADNILKARRNPLWSDKLPLLSVPVQRQPGSAKGQAPVAAVADMQYYANDVLNETADAVNYALLPIITRDPESQTAPMVLAPGAIWNIGPDKVGTLKFPEIWKEGFEILADLQAKVNQTLSVSPAMITQPPGGAKAKKNQAEIAQQQQVELLTTADAVAVAEQGIFTPLASLMLDMDYQYRDTKLLVRQYGPMGASAISEEVPPLQNDARFVVRWCGVEAARGAQQIQQKIALMGILRALPPASYPDYTLDMQPMIVDVVESTCGPQQARLTLKDHRSQLSVDPAIENSMMDDGLFVDVHPSDNDQEHIAAHTAKLKSEGDPAGLLLPHINKHAQQAMVKVAAQKMALSGGGQQKGQGQPNQTPPGAQPKGPRGVQQPAGAIPQDQMKDASVMPRKEEQ